MADLRLYLLFLLMVVLALIVGYFIGYYTGGIYHLDYTWTYLHEAASRDLNSTCCGCVQ